MSKELWVSKQISGFDSRQGTKSLFLQRVWTDIGIHSVLHKISREVFLSA